MKKCFIQKATTLETTRYVHRTLEETTANPETQVMKKSSRTE
jgi:hypothetical protein